MTEVTKEDLFSAIAKLAHSGGKPHGTTIVAVSWSYGIPDNQVMYTEYAHDGQEYVYKQQITWDAVLQSLNGKNEADSGGVIREMGEDFQASMIASGGDLAKAMTTGAPWKQKGAKQGKVDKGKGKK